jgi:hypothetical protein
MTFVVTFRFRGKTEVQERRLGQQPENRWQGRLDDPQGRAGRPVPCGPAGPSRRRSCRYGDTSRILEQVNKAKMQAESDAILAPFVPVWKPPASILSACGD